MLRIRQRFDAPRIEDPAGETARQIAGMCLTDRVGRGGTVAVACSSRGIANYAAVVKAVVDALKENGLKPFLVPAMGSHGAASAVGQRRVLEGYGLTEERMGVAIRSSLEVVSLGETADGVRVHVDRNAFAADHIVLVNRVKQHTEFDHQIESGLMKMMAIGLGKEKGAAHYHQAIMVHGYPRIIVSAARKVLHSGKILFGIGLVENGLGETARVGVLDAEGMEEGEKRLLREAKRLAPRLPFDEVDVLVLDEMGKDISGTGFDTKVVGRILMPLVAAEPERPRVKRIVVCDLTARTAGNADGVGIADFITRRLADKIDFEALYANALAGAEPEHARIPMTMANDREAIAAAARSVGLVPPAKLKIVRIPNTLRLQELEVSAAYRPQLAHRPELTVASPERPPAFDHRGNLAPFDLP
jgi:hypothetical protein